MGFSHRESLERVLKEIAEAPIEDLSSCSPQLLQKVQDKVSRVIIYDQATESTSQSATIPGRQCDLQKRLKPTTRLRESPKTASDFSTSPPVTHPKTTQGCIDAVNRHPTPDPSPEGFDGNSKARGLVGNLLKQITYVPKFLEKDVEKILCDGIRKSHEDPRIEDIGKMVKPTASDELRFLLGCLTLFDDYERFAPADRKKTKHGSQRAFGATLGIDHSGIRRLRYGIDCGRRIRTLAIDCGFGIVGFLLFVKWRNVEEDEMARFGRLCAAEEKINNVMTVTETFMNKCLLVYRRVVHERRIGNSKQSLSQKRKRSMPYVPATQQPPQYTSGLSVQLLSVCPVSIEEISRGKRTSIHASRHF